MSLLWPGAGPFRGLRLTSPAHAGASPSPLGVALNPFHPPTYLPTGLLPIEAIYRLSLPVLDESIVSFGFNTATPDGSFNFVFKWIGGVWNMWTTMPDGTVRTAGCVPLVINWCRYTDFSAVIISGLPVLGQGDLVGGTLLLIKWKVI
jgi:hypothetical protein